MHYLDKESAKVKLYYALKENGWKCYGFNPDQSDMMTDYYHPASWDGLAEKNGFVLLVDIRKHDLSMSGKGNFPIFKFENPGRSNWHIEKDGLIVAKGTGVFQVDKNNSKEFVAKLDSKINDAQTLEAVQEKVIKKVIKPVEVTNRQSLEVGDVLKFDYHGHYWLVTAVNDKTYSYENLGSEKRGYQKLNSPQRYYDYVSRFEKNIEKGHIRIFKLEEVEEITYKTVYKKAAKKEVKEVKQMEKQEQKETAQKLDIVAESNITLTVELNEELNGIELYFSEKPSKNVLDLLKVNKFRYHRLGYWYAKQTKETLTLAEGLQSIYKDLKAEVEAVQTQTETAPEQPETIENVTEEQTQVEEVKEPETVTETQYNKDGKVKVKSIMFVWSESSEIKDGLTVSTFAEAEETIKNAAFRAPDNGCYDKTKFLITWSDGQTYEGRIDIVKGDSFKSSPLKDHVLSFCNHVINDPSETWHKPETKQSYQYLLDTYSFTDDEEQHQESEKPKGKVLDFNSRFKQKKEVEQKNKTMDHFLNNILPYMTREEQLELVKVYETEDDEQIETFFNQLSFKTAIRLAKEKLKQN